MQTREKIINRKNKIIQRIDKKSESFLKLKTGTITFSTYTKYNN